jgi:hypothetical protein
MTIPLAIMEDGTAGQALLLMMWPLGILALLVAGVFLCFARTRKAAFVAGCTILTGLFVINVLFTGPGLVIVGCVIVIATGYLACKKSIPRILRYLVAICVAVIGAGLLTAYDQFNIMTAEDCWRRMQDPGPFSVRSKSGYHLRVEADGSARCNCHETMADVEEYLARKYGNWFSGMVTDIRNRILPTTACTLRRAPRRSLRRNVKERRGGT